MRSLVLPAVLALVAAAATATIAPVSADGTSGAAAAARARTNAYAGREARIHRTTYDLGPCKLIHEKPWVGFACAYTIHGLGDQCHDRLIVAVTRQKSGTYEAAAKKWTGSPAGAPC